MPDDADDIGAAVVRRYARLAEAAAAGQQVADGCFGAAAYGDAAYGAAAYGAAADDEAGGWAPSAALRASLGCGNPVAVAALAPGETVLDLGSGGGLDVLLSARRVGPAGRAYGLDGSPQMISLARANVLAAGVGNAEFLLGRIERIPLPDAAVDAVISNCVINLAVDKPRVLAEAFRVLRSGGRLGVSDVVADGDAEPAVRATAEQEVGRISGTVTEAEYRGQLLAAGFTQIGVERTADAGGGLFSAVVKAVRPAAPNGVLIRPMRAADAEQVLAIYQAGLDTGEASFEVTAPAWASFDAAKLPLHRHVAVDAGTGRLVGWVAVSPVSARPVYAGVVEHSVYVDPAARHRGVGSALLAALIGSTESAGIWTVHSSLFPENAASLRLHAKAGFRVVGTRERIGCHHGRWRDTLLLERRSAVAGGGAGVGAR